LRKGYYKELLSYKSAAKNKIKIENSLYQKKDDIISITLFDSLKGIDAQTLEIINEKIKDV
jgi:hypothetical protein